MSTKALITLRWADGKLHLEHVGLSEAQNAALPADREIAVSAGAGAGKTRTLSARYVSLLHTLVEARGEAPDVRSILVLTFTEKAAQEMRERCYQMVGAVARLLHQEAEALEAQGMPKARLARTRAAWDTLRDAFIAAAIGTFHGFCARLLREFPAETKTAPGFTVLEEGESRSGVLGAAAAAVDERSGDTTAELLLLLDTFGGRQGLVDVVATAVAHRGELAGAWVPPALPAPAVVEGWRRFLEDEWRPVTRRVLGTVHLSTKKPVEQLRALVDRALPADPLELGELYRAALEAWEGSNGMRSIGHHSFVGTKADWGGRLPGKDDLKALQEEVDAWIPRLDELASVPTRHDATLGEVLVGLGRLAADAGDRWEAKLRGDNAVDFTELQLRVAAAIETSPVLVEALQARHRYLMVDEFQDTDALQWRILTAIGRGGVHDRIFVVGDPKQAIYGFRGGDVAVFDAARRSIGHEVLLSGNYRTRKALMETLNRLFAGVLGPPSPTRPPWEAPFSALDPMRDTADGKLIVANYAGDPRSPGKPELEAAWIAAWLQGTLLPRDGASAHLWDTTKHPTPPVAILLRRRRWLPVYEAALRARGIDYVVVGGIGFWGRPEVVDVANLLAALVRGDALGRVAALRSPLFALTDQELVDLHDARLLQRFGEGEAPEMSPAVAEAWHTWATLRAARDLRSAAHLIQAILTRTGSALVQAFSSPGGRAAANLQRLLTLADAHTQAGGSLDAFVGRVLDHVDEASQDAEATLPVTDARVAILTVHASKGLEYPVVIVPDLGAPLVSRSSGPLTRGQMDDGWRVACNVPDRFGDVQGTASPAALSALQRRVRERELAEARRLFYVACTRAEDLLVLVGPRMEPGKGGSRYAGLVAEWLAADRLEAVDVLDLDAWEEPQVVVDPPPPLPPPGPDAARRIGPIVAGATIEVSPSSLGQVRTDPVAWWLRHVVGVPEVVLAPPRMARERAILVGDVLHALLEDLVLEPAPARARWRAAAAGLPAEEVEIGEAEVLRQLTALRGSAEVWPLLDARGNAELPIRYDRGRISLVGRVDRLVKDTDGAWMVVDFKTGAPKPVEAGWRTQLLGYSVAASRVLEAHGHAPVARGAILYTRTGTLERLPDWTPEDRIELDALLDEALTLVEGGPPG